MKLVILVMTVLLGSGEKTIVYAGPMTQNACEAAVTEIIDLSVKRSESHALVLECRQPTPEELALLRKHDERKSVQPDKRKSGRT